MHPVPQRRLGIAKPKVIYFVLDVLLPCLKNKPSSQVGNIDRSREAAAVCIGHSRGIRRVAELCQLNDLSKSSYCKRSSYMVDFEHISGDKAASSEFTLSNAVLDHHLRLISGAFDCAGESLLDGASSKDRADIYFNLVRNVTPSLKCCLLK